MQNNYITAISPWFWQQIARADKFQLRTDNWDQKKEFVRQFPFKEGERIRYFTPNKNGVWVPTGPADESQYKGIEFGPPLQILLHRAGFPISPPLEADLLAYPQFAFLDFGVYLSAGRTKEVGLTDRRQGLIIKPEFFEHP